MLYSLVFFRVIVQCKYIKIIHNNKVLHKKHQTEKLIPWFCVKRRLQVCEYVIKEASFLFLFSGGLMCDDF